jgi:poly-gamma-glutamate capsule biosynthesis protein CapA/YwtB (metallophosphatase superfamily)
MRRRRGNNGLAAGAALCLLLALLGFPGEPRPPRPVLLALGGDVMLGRGVARALDGEWEAAFAEVRPWLVEGGEGGEVLALANLESPLTELPQVKAGHDLRAPPAAAAALRAAGFDALSLANNHALDVGAAGVRDTVHALRRAGIVAWLDRETAARVEGLDASLPWRRYGVAGLALDDSTVPVDVAAAVEVIAAAAARGDAVVVSIHWGGEYQAAPSARQQALARAFAAAGADVVAGHGPHVLQPVEWVGDTLVAYSLGNVLFDQPYPLDCRWGAILRVTLREGRACAVEAVPTVVERGRVRLADPGTAAAIGRRLGCPLVPASP